jgi:hypothetical protein
MVQAISLCPLRTKNCFDPRLFYVTFEADKVAETEVFVRVFRGSSAIIISPVPFKHLQLYEALSRTHGQSHWTYRKASLPEIGGGVLGPLLVVCLHVVKKFYNLKIPTFLSDIFRPVLHCSSPSLHNHIAALLHCIIIFLHFYLHFLY